ncbi:MAG TPA: AraC family transcriptional regulator [Spirochaetota bacterium]|nr:AraC family transcriptional regulator [Spirochaetota bacterium]HPJ36261.1 AraC family transcriptional regulator [Spirochaetota bacterium]
MDKINILIISLIIFGPFLCLLMTAAQIMKKDPLLPIYYSLAHLSMGLWLFQSLCYSTDLFGDSSVFYTAIIPLTFFAPLFQRYRYTWVVFSKKISSSFFSGFTYLLAISATLYVTVIFIITINYGFQSYLKFNPIFSESFTSLPLSYKMLHILYPAPKLISIISLLSLIIVIIRFWKEKKEEAPVKFLMLSIFILSLITFATFLVLLGDFISFKLCSIGLSLATITICIMVIVSYRYPSLRKYIIFKLEKTRYMKSKIKNLDLNVIVKRMKEIMELEKAFSDEDFCLKTLARDLDITPQQLSQILNEKLGKNFNTFLNEYRINEAKKLLIDEPARSINSIANAVGFNSNTAFTLAFTKHEGVSPSKFRKNNI